MNVHLPNPAGKPGNKPLKEWQSSDEEDEPEAQPVITREEVKASSINSGGRSPGKGGSQEPEDVPQKPAPLPRRPVPAENGTKKTRRTEIIEGLKQSYVLLLVGGGLLVASIVIWGVPTQIGTHYYPLWAMFFIDGAVAVAGGTIASLVPEGEEGLMPQSNGTYVVIERKEWTTTMNELTTLRVLVNKVLPKDLIKVALSPTERDTSAKPSIEKFNEEVEIQAAKTEALRIALSNMMGRKDLGTVGSEQPSPFPTMTRIEPVEKPVEPPFSEPAPQPKPSPVAEPITPERQVAASMFPSTPVIVPIPQPEPEKPITPPEAPPAPAPVPIPEPEKEEEVEPQVIPPTPTVVPPSGPEVEEEAEEKAEPTVVPSAPTVVPPSEPEVEEEEEEVEKEEEAEEEVEPPVLPPTPTVVPIPQPEVEKQVEPPVVPPTPPVVPPPQPEAEKPVAPPVVPPTPPVVPPPKREAPEISPPAGVTITPPFPAAPPEPKITPVPERGPQKLTKLEGPTPPAQGRIGVVDWEEAAFRAAYTAGINRNANETATEYFNRVNSVIGKGLNAPNAIAKANAAYSTLMEAHRGLTERQMDKLSTLLEEHRQMCEEAIEVPKNPRESFLDYLVRVRGVLETRTRKETPVVPPKELEGLNWSLTLFRVFLEGYIGLKETEAVMADVEKGAGVGGAAKPVHKLGQEDDFMTYAQLVKNSLKSLSARGIESDKADQVLREFEDFVSDMSESAPNVPGLTRNPDDVKKEAPERIRKMFEWMGKNQEGEKG